MSFDDVKTIYANAKVAITADPELTREDEPIMTRWYAALKEFHPRYVSKAVANLVWDMPTAEAITAEIGRIRAEEG